MATNYISTHGMIWGEISDTGVTTSYGHDALGSVSETFSGGSLENTYRYKPYGMQLAKTGTAADPRFLWNGGSGYRATTLPDATHFVRQRHYSSTVSIWTTTDMLWPSERAYSYISGRPMTISDPSGQFPCSGSGEFTAKVPYCPVHPTCNTSPYCLDAFRFMTAQVTVTPSPAFCVCSFIQCIQSQGSSNTLSPQGATCPIGTKAGLAGWFLDGNIQCPFKSGNLNLQSLNYQSRDAPGPDGFKGLAKNCLDTFTPVPIAFFPFTEASRVTNLDLMVVCSPLVPFSIGPLPALSPVVFEKEWSFFFNATVSNDGTVTQTCSPMSEETVPIKF